MPNAPKSTDRIVCPGCGHVSGSKVVFAKVHAPRCALLQQYRDAK